MIESKYLTIKEIAGLLEMSKQSICRNEARLGIAKFRIVLNCRNVRFRRKETLAALRLKGYEV